MNNFQGLSKKFPTTFWRLIFTFHFPSEAIFSREKGNLKFSGSNIRRREESENVSLS